jgi:hypothetical protein
MNLEKSKHLIICYGEYNIILRSLCLQQFTYMITRNTVLHCRLYCSGVEFEYKDENG